MNVYQGLGERDGGLFGPPSKRGPSKSLHQIGQTGSLLQRDLGLVWEG